MSPPLILKRGSANAPDDNNYEVLAGGVVVGRIIRVAAAPKTPWFWSLASDYRKDRTPTQGYEPTRDAAMAAFEKSWRRE